MRTSNHLGYLLQPERNECGQKNPVNFILKEVAVVGFSTPVHTLDHLTPEQVGYLWDDAVNNSGIPDLDQCYKNARKNPKTVDYSMPLHATPADEIVSGKTKLTYEENTTAVVCAPQFAHLTMARRQVYYEENLKCLVTTAMDSFENLKKSRESNQCCTNAEFSRLRCMSSDCSACDLKQNVAVLQEQCDKVFQTAELRKLFFAVKN